jgi:hypothetical protein
MNGKRVSAAANRFSKIAGSTPGRGSASFVAAEIIQPAGIGDGWLHCNIQVACQS